MKYRIIFDESQDDDFIIYAKEKSTKLEKIENLLNENESSLFGYSDGVAWRINTEEIFAFLIEGGKIYALTEKKKLLLKERLYKLEDDYKSCFMKINQSCLIRVDKIQSFGASIGGCLTVTLKNGYTDYISRRQVKAVKERMGLSK